MLWVVVGVSSVAGVVWTWTGLALDRRGGRRPAAAVATAVAQMKQGIRRVTLGLAVPGALLVLVATFASPGS